MINRRNKIPHLMKRKKIYERVSREEEDDIESQSGHKNMIQAEGGGLLQKYPPPHLC